MRNPLAILGPVRCRKMRVARGRGERYQYLVRDRLDGADSALHGALLLGFDRNLGGVIDGGIWWDGIALSRVAAFTSDFSHHQKSIADP